MSLSLLFLLLLGYVLYRFVVGFVLPVTRTARGMKKQFDQMKQQAGYTAEGAANTNSHQQAHSYSNDDSGPSQQRTTSGRKGAKEDYIDFEEVPTAKR